jgi:hypothetical protein
MTRQNNSKQQHSTNAHRRCIEALEQSAHPVLADASQALARSHLPHYEPHGAGQNWKRLQLLYELIFLGVQLRNPTAIVKHARTLAVERFAGHFRLREVQTAFNVLEEAIWERLAVQLCPEDFVATIGLVSGVIGAGRDAVAETFVTLARRGQGSRHAPEALFKGTVGA